MAEPQTTSQLLKLPGEIRDRIYRLTVVSATPICISAAPRQGDGTIIYSPPYPKLGLACRTLSGEIKSIYYQENTFQFTEYALRFARLEEFRQRAGPFASRLTSIMVTKAFGIEWFAGKLQFTAELLNYEVEVNKFMSDCVNGPIWIRGGRARGLCYCTVRRIARCASGTLLEFLEDYLAADGIWKGEQANVMQCQACNKLLVVRVGADIHV